MSENISFLQVARKRSWLRLLFPLVLIIYVAEYLVTTPVTLGDHALLVAVALLLAAYITAFVIRCTQVFMTEAKRRRQDLFQLQKEIEELEKTSSKPKDHNHADSNQR